MSEIKLGWASAEVRDAKLRVALEGEPPRGWQQSFERTAQLLGDGEWGAIKIKKGAVQVSDVTAGTEEKLRHHLESIVAQANATHEAREREGRGEPEDPDDERRGGPDAEMTGRFRSFAEASEDSGAR